MIPIGAMLVIIGISGSVDPMQGPRQRATYAAMALFGILVIATGAGRWLNRYYAPWPL